MINESNITNKDRVQRHVEGIIKSFNPKVDPKECTLIKTSKGNWRTEHDGKRVCVISKFTLSDEMATELGYHTPEPPANEPPANEPPADNGDHNDKE